MRVSGLGRLVMVQALLGVAVIALLLWRVDVLDALRGLPHVRVWWVLGGLCAFTASKVVHAGRWRFLLRHRPEVPMRDLLALFLLANFVNATIPLRVGDLIRIELPSRRYGVPRAEMASNVMIVESLFDGVSFVLLMLGAVVLIDIPAAVRPVLLTVGTVILAVFAVAVAAARSGWGSNVATLQRWRLVAWLPEGWRDGAARRLGDVLVGMASLSRTRDALIALGFSVVGWLLEVTMYWALAHGFSLPLAFPQTLLVTVVANLIVAVPLTPWNVGPFELALTELLQLLGTDRATAAQFAVGSHLLLELWVSATGIFAMWSLHLGMRDLRRRIDETVQAKR
ncbi:MAG: UPF0104 family protein [Chloroflexi bacterium]|nr:MAG: UPF0104 family protein [Chloroflexota bacterium]